MELFLGKEYSRSTIVSAPPSCPDNFQLRCDNERSIVLLNRIEKGCNATVSSQHGIDILQYI